MHQLEKDGDKRAGLVNKLISDRERLIGAILLGNNLVNILASIAGGRIVREQLMPGPERCRRRDRGDDPCGGVCAEVTAQDLCDYAAGQYGDVVSRPDPGS